MWEGDKLTLYTANQMLHARRRDDRDDPADPEGERAARQPLRRRRLRRQACGLADAILAALAARQLEAAGQVALTRQQVFHVTTHRSDTIQRVRLAPNATARCTAIGHDPGRTTTPGEQFYETAANADAHALCGAEPADARIGWRRSICRSPPSMRAPGEAVGLLALECAMDELADALDIDPIELRIRNEPATIRRRHVPFSSRAAGRLPAGGRRARSAGPSATPSPASRDGRWLVGMGMAAAIRGNLLQAVEGQRHARRRTASRPCAWR